MIRIENGAAELSGSSPELVCELADAVRAVCLRLSDGGEEESTVMNKVCGAVSVAVKDALCRRRDEQCSLR